MWNIVSVLNRRREGLVNVVNYDHIINRFESRHAFNANLPELDLDSVFYTPERTSDPPIFAAQFCKHANYLDMIAIASEDGRVALRQINDINSTTRDVIAHDNAIFDVAWRNKGTDFVTVSGDQSAILWKLTESTATEESQFLGHTRSVRAVRFKPQDNNIFTTGGRDGVVFLWDLRDPRQPDNKISICHVDEYQKETGKQGKKQTIKQTGTITSLDFCDENTLVTSSSRDGLIKAWDIRKNYSLHTRQPIPKYELRYAGTSRNKGYTHILIDRSRQRLYANCVDSTIYCYNANGTSPLPVSLYKGHQTSSYYVQTCISPDGHYLVSGSSDENAYIWNTDCQSRIGSYCEPVVKLIGHTGEVTCVAWSPLDHFQLVTCGDDALCRVWSIGKEEPDQDFNLEGWAERVDPENETYNSFSEVLPSYLALKLHRPAQKRKFDATRRTAPTVRNEGNPVDLCAPNAKKRCVSYSSPTSNLPNYVVDGTSRHICRPSPKRESTNWLTKLHLEREQKAKSNCQTKAGVSTKVKRCKTTEKKTGRKRRNNILSFFSVVDSKDDMKNSNQDTAVDSKDDIKNYEQDTAVDSKDDIKNSNQDTAVDSKDKSNCQTKAGVSTKVEHSKTTEKKTGGKRRNNILSFFSVVDSKDDKKNYDQDTAVDSKDDIKNYEQDTAVDSKDDIKNSNQDTAVDSKDKSNCQTKAGVSTKVMRCKTTEKKTGGKRRNNILSFFSAVDSKDDIKNSNQDTAVDSKDDIKNSNQDSADHEKKEEDAQEP